MPQEPWKRASQLQRAVPREVRSAPAPPPYKPPPKRWPLLLLLLIPIALAGWFYWESIEPIWYRLLGREATAPAATKPTLKLPLRKPEKVAITGDSLDAGLGIGGSVYQDYHTVLDKTKDRGIEWSFTGAGNALRISAPGVTLYADGTNITAYTLKFDAIWDEEHWDWWVDELAKAGLTEQTAPADVSAQGVNQTRLSLYGSRSIHQNKGWATPAFELSFFQGKLDELHAGIKPGPGPTEPASAK